MKPVQPIKLYNEVEFIRHQVRLKWFCTDKKYTNPQSDRYDGYKINCDRDIISPFKLTTISTSTCIDCHCVINQYKICFEKTCRSCWGFILLLAYEKLKCYVTVFESIIRLLYISNQFIEIQVQHLFKLYDVFIDFPFQTSVNFMNVLSIATI